MSDCFVARPGSWEVAYTNDGEDFVVANVSYNNDSFCVEIKFIDDYLSFDSMDSFNVLVEQLTVAMQTVFNQNKATEQ
jgi:uncharacterized membrane protein YukC